MMLGRRSRVAVREMTEVPASIASRWSAGCRDDDLVALIAGRALPVRAGIVYCRRIGGGNGRLVAVGTSGMGGGRDGERRRGCAQQEQMTRMEIDSGNLGFRRWNRDAECGARLRAALDDPDSSGAAMVAPGFIRSPQGAWERIEWAGAPVRYGMRPAGATSETDAEAAPPRHSPLPADPDSSPENPRGRLAIRCLTDASQPDPPRPARRRDRSDCASGRRRCPCQTNASNGTQRSTHRVAQFDTATLHPRFAQAISKTASPVTAAAMQHKYVML